MSKTETAKILFRGIIKPTNWSDPGPATKLRVEIEKYFGNPVYPVNSGRSSIYLLLLAAGISEGDEVLIQAYTCNAVPNPIIWLGATPIYVDIDPDTLNMDTDDLEKKITNKSRVVILQHTFGRPGPVEKVLEIAKKHGLLVIEDCAHSLGAKFKGKKLGTFGDGAILSFGREKVISSLAGGAILVNNSKLIKPLENLFKDLDYAPFSTFLQEVNNFITWRVVIRKIFFTDFGRSLLSALNSTNFFNVVYTNEELHGKKPEKHPSLFPGTLAEIALTQFSNIDDVNEERNKAAVFYSKNIKNNDFKMLPDHDGVYLRFILLHERAEEVLKKARKNKFWFSDWYNSPVYPKKTDLESMKYKAGTCPVAELLSRQTINLPIYRGVTELEMKRVTSFINSYY